MLDADLHDGSKSSWLLATYLMPGCVMRGSGWDLRVRPAVLAASGNLEICESGKVTKQSDQIEQRRKKLLTVFATIFDHVLDGPNEYKK